VVNRIFGQDAESRAEAVAPGLPDGPGYSPAVLLWPDEGRDGAESGPDKPQRLQASAVAWLYDLNFTASLRMVSERDYIQKLAAMLSPNEEIAHAVDRVQAYGAGKTDRQLIRRCLFAALLIIRFTRPHIIGNMKGIANN